MRFSAAPLVAAAAVLLLAVAPPFAGAQEPGKPSQGLSLFGDLKYGPDFKHFDYVNPDAPKGGTARFASVGTYDTLNPFIVSGNPAAGIGSLYDTLMTPSADEPSSEYGLVAESVEVAPDRTWVLYTLRKEARFSDGSAITPDDVVWSFETLKAKGRPQYRGYYGDVVKVEKVGERGVKFTFKSGDNRELPQILGQVPVLSRAYWTAPGHDFTKTTLEQPVSSGPYRIEAMDPGRSITYRRVADYWGADLPVSKGRNNFDVIRYDYYRDRTVALEAFKAGQYDIRLEATAKDWATGYDTPAFREGLFKKEEIPNQRAAGMQAFGFNLRRDLFKDPLVRQALAYGFDFEWTNRNLFYGMYKRTKSYFENSELASSGVPQGEELEILEKYRGKVPDEVFTKAYEPPATDGSGNIRDNIREALKLFKAAGWTIKGKQLVNEKTGQPFEFEILTYEPIFERILLPFKANLEKFGINARVRTVDPAQYQKRMDTFDYDMTVVLFPESLSPGNEQRDYWGSAAAKEEGSQNLLSVQNPVVDELVEQIVNAPDRQSLIARVHALDRVLLWGHYVIPNWYYGKFNVAYWNKFHRPSVAPKYDIGFDTWWIDQKEEQTVESRKGEVAKQ